MLQGGSHYGMKPQFLGTGMMVVILKHFGITDWDKDRLNITVNMPCSFDKAVRTVLYCLARDWLINHGLVRPLLAVPARRKTLISC